MARKTSRTIWVGRSFAEIIITSPRSSILMSGRMASMALASCAFARSWRSPNGNRNVNSKPLSLNRPCIAAIPPARITGELWIRNCLTPGSPSADSPLCERYSAGTLCKSGDGFRCGRFGASRWGSTFRARKSGCCTSSRSKWRRSSISARRLRVSPRRKACCAVRSAATRSRCARRS